MKVFRDLRLVQRRPTLDAFTAVVEHALHAQQPVRHKVALAMHRLHTQRGEEFNSSFADPWADDFLLNCIGTEMLMSQYLACVTMEDSGALQRGHAMAGIIDPDCDVAQICRDTAMHVQQITEDTTGRCPLIQVQVFQERAIPRFSYIPGFLRFIMTEVLKNSCRATAEVAKSDRDVQKRPISVIVCADDHEVAIRVSDRARGIPFVVGQKVWSYLYTTAGKGPSYGDGATSLAGYGVGLPLSRLYARYLGGSLNLVSLPGYGTSVDLFLPRVNANQDDVSERFIGCAAKYGAIMLGEPIKPKHATGNSPNFVFPRVGFLGYTYFSNVREQPKLVASERELTHFIQKDLILLLDELKREMDQTFWDLGTWQVSFLITVKVYLVAILLATTAVRQAAAAGNSTECGEDASEPVLPLFATLPMIAFLVALSGLFSGLTLGLMGLDVIGLQIVQKGENKELARCAAKIAPIRESGNQLLCTLLLGNVAVNSALSILTADIANGIVGFLVSTALIVTFGEILPQAACSRYALQVGARTVPIVKFLMILFFIVTKPMSLALDWLLGQEVGTIHSRTELMEMLKLQISLGAVDAEEGKIAQQVAEGALSFRDKQVGDIMTPLEDAYFLNSDTKLGYDAIREIFETGFSFSSSGRNVSQRATDVSNHFQGRIPIYGRDKHDYRGLLYTKDDCPAPAL
ncbi:cnnm4 [Symbiodinium natans]|uniref:Cnnm4 protein n=1 Tax=Symbiodinium natans TaxID=878477 RepID=A0A812MCX3_9DINO|nr:cnnm4 [Symbiodinium natans]